jgi:CRP/FNR family transcriptional regulator, cyclic AMP receptor protein
MDAETFLKAGGLDKSLASIELLKGVTGDAARRIEQRCSWKFHPKGAIVLNQDDDTHEVLFVRCGRVRVVQFTATGREIGFAEINPGGHVGELAAIDGGRRSASVIAVTDTVTASLSAPDFLALLRDTPALALNLLKAMARAIRGTNVRVHDLRSLTAAGRIVHELLRLAGRGRTSGNLGRIKLQPAPTQAEIAASAGTTRETVARTLGELERRGLVARGSRSLELVDIEGLETFMEDDAQAG